MEITTNLVTQLISEQFPQWSHLPIKSVEIDGHDNRTFRLGDEMSVRMPSAEPYAAKVHKEQKWLPILAPHISLSIPQPIALGQPSQNYPWNWSIYKWLEGTSANALELNDLTLQTIALQLANFLNELHRIDITNAPLAGAHNFFRGGNLAVYDSEARTAISELKNLIDANKAILLWEKSLSSKWQESPVWIHGDFAAGNILVRNDQLSAVIDFGGTAIGDPACDLVIAWTFLKNKSREIFKENLHFDSNTWDRARGWALWKASIELVKIKDKANSNGKKHLQIIEEILN